MSRSPLNRPGGSPASDYERQSAEECGLCALRNVLAPYQGANLPTWPSLVRDARSLERGEEALTSSDQLAQWRSRWRSMSLRPSNGVPCFCICCSEDSDGPERADEDGNFGVEVLMRAAARQQIDGKPVVMEYWGGRHREAAEGREFGFILGSGDHWWCIRRCGRQLENWEEVDSLEEQVGRTWVTDVELRRYLRRCEDTVLVLYSIADAETSSSESRATEECTAETDSDGPKAER
mmetsp:Transcript_15844/g.50080  ORF Transcript_15844/g.50080 Transcript_15844/m.50080 type:complete len:236 (-) Transcript_15844:60-767(-)